MRYQAALLPVPSNPIVAQLLSSLPEPGTYVRRGRLALLGTFLRAGFRGRLFLRAADRVAQRFTRRKRGDAACRDDELLSGLGVATLALFPVAHNKTAERD